MSGPVLEAIVQKRMRGFAEARTMRMGGVEGRRTDVIFRGTGTDPIPSFLAAAARVSRGMVLGRAIGGMGKPVHVH